MPRMVVEIKWNEPDYEDQRMNFRTIRAAIRAGAPGLKGFTFSPLGRLPLRPLNDRLIIRPFEPKEMSPGGIILPDNSREKPQRGMVVAVGPGKRGKNGKRLEMDVRVGETILYAKYAGGEIKVDGERLLVMDEADVLGIVQTVPLSKYTDNTQWGYSFNDEISSREAE